MRCKDPCISHQAYPDACHTLCRDLNIVGGRAFSEYLPNKNSVRSNKLFWPAGDIDPNDPDSSWHGTHVAGIIGAKNDGRGPYGVLPGESCGVVKMAAARALNGRRNCTTERSV